MQLRLPDSEWLIMETLWKASPKTSTELFDLLKSETGWSKSTVKTLLTRLLEKEAITYEKVGRSRYYSPILNHDACMKEAADTLIQRFYNGAVSSMLMHFIKDESLTSDDINELEKLLEAKKNRLKGDEK